jgi:DNA-directed RNA polymerase sigma subunit (sigma70/sigma32)
MLRLAIVIELRLNGWSYAAIGRQLGVSRQRAQQLDREAMQLRQLWLEQAALEGLAGHA